MDDKESVFGKHTMLDSGHIFQGVKNNKNMEVVFGSGSACAKKIGVNHSRPSPSEPEW